MFTELWYKLIEGVSGLLTSLLTFFYWPFVVRVITRKLRSQQLFIELF